MEYKTVLKNPETHIEIDSLVKTTEDDSRTTGARRFCSHCKMRNVVLGGVLVFTLISLLAQLPLHVQSIDHQKQLKVNAEKIKDLLIAYEIQMQQIRGTNYNTEVDKTGVRNERTVSSSTPHFYLRGHERTTYNEGRRATDNGIFMWKMPPSFGQSSFFSASGRNNADGSFTKVQIHQSGMYFVFAKVTANGRTQMSSADPPPVGIVLKRESSGQGPDELDISWVTQDDRGQDYGTFTRNSQEAKFPMDTISVAGLYRLDVNDKIYIQVPDDSIYRRNERFLGEGLKSHFGAFLVEACSSC